MFGSPGHFLARDLVFVPQQPLTADAMGFGGAAPRAVPLDTVLALVTHVVDGGVVARVVVPLVLAAAGWGAHRLVSGLGFAARLTAAGLAVWNPFVVERLALGQWALLAAYAALPWLALVGARVAAGGRRRHVVALVLWLAVASLTPTGGLLGTGVAGAAATTRRARTWWVLPVGLLLQTPWIVAGLLGGAAVTSDPAGVRAFASRADGPGGAVVAVIGLGGVWHSPSVPATRDLGWGIAAALLVVAAVVTGWGRLAETLGRPALLRLAAAAAVGLLLAVGSALPGGQQVWELAIAHVPGAGLLRDAQKWLAPFVLFAVVALAALVERAGRWSTARRADFPLVVVPVFLPLLLVPDATVTVWPTLRPVELPAGFTSAQAELDRAAVSGDGRPLVTLPWRSYRGFSWGNGVVASDPALRLFDRPVLVSDDLVVDGQTIRGESLAAREVGRALEEAPPAQALAALGVGWVLVYRDDPAAPTLDLTGLVAAHVDPEIALYRVPRVARP